MSKTPPRSAAGRRDALGRLALLLFVGPWVILQNNGRIADNVPSHVGFSLIQLPRASRVVEAALLIGLFLVCQPRLLRARLGDFSAYVAVFLFAALVGIALNQTWPISQFQGTYVYVAPYLLFGWAVTARPTRQFLDRMVRVYSVYLVIGIAVALLVQLPETSAKGDFIHGLFSDAHAFGTVLAVFSCVAFSRFMAVGGIRLLLLAVVLFLVSYFPANEKMIAFNLAWWAGALGWRPAMHPRSRRGRVIGSIACAAVLWIVVVRIDYVGEWFRVDEVAKHDVLEQGPIKAWTRSAYVVTESPLTLLVGVGSGNFAGVAAERALEDDPVRYRTLSERAATTLREAERDRSALGSGGNTWTNLLAEFGALGFLLFTLALVRIAWPIARWRPVTSEDASARTMFLAGLSSVVFQGLITPYTNWNEPLLVYPVMVVAAYCYNAAVEDRLRHPSIAATEPISQAAVTA